MSESNKTGSTPAWRWFGRMDAHHRFFIALGAALVAFALLPSQLTWATRLLGTWDAFVYTSLGLMWTLILTADAKEAVTSAKLEDSGRAAISLLVLAGACMSVFAVVYELGVAKHAGHQHTGWRAFFCIATTFATWFLVHTVYTIRYAHQYYGTDEHDKTRGGLDFPEDDEPGYLDFAYFAFTVGMCAQTSDVSVNDPGMRRLCLVHSLISYYFNVAVVGMSINAISGLLQ